METNPWPPDYTEARPHWSVAIVLFVLVLGYSGLAGPSNRVIRIGHGGCGITAQQGHIETYKTNLLMYQGMNGQFPTTEQGLAALISKPEGYPQPKNWREIMGEPIIDPWGRSYVYQCPGSHNPNHYDVYSVGPDGKAGTGDDTGNW